MKYLFLKYIRWIREFGIRRAIWALNGNRTQTLALTEIKSRSVGALSIRDTGADFEAINTVICFEAYKIQTEVQFKNIIDCGANIGISARYFLSHHPAATVFAIEPSPENLELLKRNCRENLSKGRVKVFNGAVGSEAGWGYLECSRPNGFDSFYVGDAKSDVMSDEFQVQIHELAELLDKKERPLLLKLDIEGAEKELIKTVLNWMHLVDYIMVECHGRDIERDWTAVFNNSNWVITKQFDTLHIARATIDSF